MKIPSAQRHGQGFLVEVSLDPLYCLLPILGGFLVQPQMKIVGEQRLDRGHIAGDGVIVGAAAETYQGTSHDVGKPPGKLAEGGAVALGRELGGDTRCHLRDPRKIPHRVIALGYVGKPKMEDMKLVQSTGPPCLGVHPAQQVDVALGIEADHHIPAPDILSDQDLQQASLANTRGAKYQLVADPLTDVHPDVSFFLGADTMERGRAADGGQRAQRIPGAILLCQSRQPRQQGAVFQAEFHAPGGLIEFTRLQITLCLWMTGFHQSLSVSLIPAKTTSQK